VVTGRLVEVICLHDSAGFPDPFAVATISGEQTRTTGVIKKTLNPYWNESFDMYVEARWRHSGMNADKQAIGE
jgi:Ca2+-dependent lipid-binding protein